MRFGALVALCLVIGAAVGIGVATLVGSDGSSSEEQVSESVLDSGDADLLDTSREAQQTLAEDFLKDWHRFRNAPGVVTSTITRTAADGAVLEDTQVLVQDETGRLLRGFAGVQGYNGNTAVFCSSAIGDAANDDGLDCKDDTTAPSRSEALATELDTISGLVIGDPPRYRLIDNGDCWQLSLTLQTADAPYGDDTLFCFDEATGTMARSETTYSNGLVETITADSVRTVVTPEDFLSLIGS